jgi:hypothetical protein
MRPRAGLLAALAIAIHNFPEGLQTFVSALADPALGIVIALAIALHNIPEVRGGSQHTVLVLQHPPLTYYLYFESSNEATA